jgi:integrase/recombinase XerD
MRERNCRPDSIVNIQYCIRTFTKSYGNISMSSVTPDMIRVHLQKYKYGHSQNSVRSRFQAFFKYFVLNKLLKFDPTPKLEVVHVDEKEIDILTCDEVRLWMKESVGGNRQKQPYTAVFALLFFAGIRPREVSRMVWEQIRHDTGSIEIPGEIAKTRKTRYLHDLPDNLWSWLPTGRKGPIVSGLGAIQMQRVRMRERNSKLRWSHDVARHSFCTYAYWRGIEWAMRISGHRNFSTYIRHYVDPRQSTTKESEEYFSII